MTKLEEALKSLRKDYGDGAVIEMTADPEPIEVIRTGALPLDLALGVGGLPKGRIVEIYGPESSGKTTLAWHIIAEAQKLGGKCVMIDVEHAGDPIYAEAIGVDLGELLMAQPSSGEEALEIADRLCRTGEISVLVVDSVAALVPRAELEGSMGDAHMGLQARLMGQALRKINPGVAASGTICIFINQLREKIGVMFGSPETTPGGKALKFYASVRLDVRRKEGLKDDGEASGNRTKVKVVKNKVAPPMRVAEFDIIFGKGISQAGCVLDIATERGLLSKNGNWYVYQGEKLANGRGKSVLYLEDHPDMLEELRELLSA